MLITSPEPWPGTKLIIAACRHQNDELMIRGHTISIIGGDKTPMFGQPVCLSLPSIGPQHSDRDLSVVDAQKWYCAMKGDGITILLNISRALVE